MPLSDEDMYKMFGPLSCAPDEIKHVTQKIYFIVAYCTEDHKHRCFGYCRSLYSARATLQTVWKDIEECYYDAFFIESFKEGVHPVGQIEEYYEIDLTNKTLILRDVPLNFKNTINWAIG